MVPIGKCIPSKNRKLKVMSTGTYYEDALTPGAGKFLGYQQDFTSSGSFATRFFEDAREEYLIFDCCYGNFSTAKMEWGQGVVYRFHVNYHSHLRVSVTIEPVCSAVEQLTPETIKFIQKAAENSFLYNSLVGQGRIKFRENEDPWVTLKNSIELFIDSDEEIESGRLWYKTMTVEEAKRLFADLKIEIDFPS